MRASERLSGGDSRAYLGQPRRNFSPAERIIGRDWGPARVADIGGDRGDWSVVRSRKRKATEQEYRGQDRSRVPDWHRGKGSGNDKVRLYDSDRVSKTQLRFPQEDRVWADTRTSKGYGGRFSSSEWHSSDALQATRDQGRKISFYVTNFPDNMPLFRLRQAFEVCGILSDVYVARYRNARGQEFGFVRFVNVKNIEKLSQALNNVWIGDCRVLAKEARFDRFAHNDVKPRDGVVPVEDVTGKGRVMERSMGEGVKNIRLEQVQKDVDGLERKKEKVDSVKEGPRSVGKVVRVGNVEVRVGDNVRKKQKVRWAEDGLSGEDGVSALAGRKTELVTGVGGNDGGGKQPVRQKETKQVTGPSKVQHDRSNVKFVSVFKSNPEDRKWASLGMVASVIVGDSALALQQRVEDAGFHHVVVVPMGGIEFFFIAIMGRMCGQCLMMLFIFLECCLVIFIDGRS
jgi:RNA recognition motif-containing protein